MNWRVTLLSGLLATGLMLTAVPGAEAKNCHRGSYDDAYYGGDSYGTSYAQCGDIANRIRRDQAKIDEFGSTGRHQKAMQWFQNDLRNAYADMDQCRSGGSNARYYPRYDDRNYGSYGRSYDPYYGRNTSYDPYNGRNTSYDPYYGGGSNDPFDYDGDGKFKFKNDWPALLGIFAGAQLGQ